MDAYQHEPNKAELAYNLRQFLGLTTSCSENHPCFSYPSIWLWIFRFSCFHSSCNRVHCACSGQWPFYLFFFFFCRPSFFDLGESFINTHTIILIFHMYFGLWPFNFFFPVLFLFDWVGVLWPHLSKVLKFVRWACSVLFPPVSLQRQAVCLLLRPVFMCSSQGRAYTVSWMGQIKVIATSDLRLFVRASNLLPSLPTTFPYKPGAGEQYWK